QFFDAYTATRHVKWSTEGAGWAVVEDEEIALGKIPAVYMWRPLPIWEKTSSLVYEMEWALSRNGNYLRQNARPVFAVFADEMIPFGGEGSPDREFRSVVQFPKDGSAQYITWAQSVESLKFQYETLRSLYFTQLQLPDWSYEKMSQIALSGESRKQLFIDAQMKAENESGRLVEAFDRETRVVKTFLKAMLPESYAADVDALPVETQVTPFSIADEADTIKNLVSANGGKPLISQRESVEQLGWSDDVDRTMKEIGEESAVQNAFGLTE
ncbi:MAG: phage portal protein, partial [Bacteroidales bacterium]|nr:phage portal protein [Bacteroidales bacterium]